MRQRPYFALFATYQSPLVQTDSDLASDLRAAERGIPVITVHDRIRWHLQKIQATHRPRPLTGDAAEEIQALREAAEAHQS